LLQIVQLILFIVDSGCTKHMTGNLKLLCNSVEKFLGTVRFGNGHQFQASFFMEMTSDHNRSELVRIQDHSNGPSSLKLVPKFVPLAFKTATSRQELELLVHHHIPMLRTTEHPSDTNVFTMKMEILYEILYESNL
ncbi:hypothetical protein Tco_0125423, partial [Tanacetum coccineum]